MRAATGGWRLAGLDGADRRSFGFAVRRAFGTVRDALARHGDQADQVCGTGPL
jgi:hypothetical protein